MPAMQFEGMDILRNYQANHTTAAEITTGLISSEPLMPVEVDNVPVADVRGFTVGSHPPSFSAGHQIFKATGILMAANVISKLLGFGREILIAKSFGVSAQVDGFFVALALPDLIGAGFGGAIGVALVPGIVASLETGKSTRKRFLRYCLISTLLLGTIMLSVLLFNAKFLVALIAPGLNGVGLVVAVKVTKLFSLVTLGMLLFNVFGAMLQAFGKFAITAGAQVLFNGVTILALLLFAHRYGIAALAYGWTTAIGVAVALLGLSIIRRLAGGPADEVRFSEVSSVFWKAMQIVVVLSMPVAFFSVTRAFASNVGAGSVAVLGYVQRLFNVPADVVFSAVALGSYPSLARLSSDGHEQTMASTVDRLCRAIVLFSTLIATVEIASSRAIVSLVFQRGAFDFKATEATSAVLVMFIPALAALGVVTLVGRVFMSRQDPLRSLKPLLCGLALNVLASWLLVRKMELVGLAMASTISWFATAAMMIVLFRKHNHSFALGAFAIFFAKVAFIASISLVVARFAPGPGIVGLILRSSVISAFFTAGIWLFLPSERELLRSSVRHAQARLSLAFTSS
jgi:putative peptidoglycan lipid II flippase